MKSDTYMNESDWVATADAAVDKVYGPAPQVDA